MIVNADCLDHLKTLPDNTVDCLVTDPPYGISFMGKSWDDFSKGQEKFKKLKAEGKEGLSLAMEQNLPIYNFEGMIEFFVPIWKECLRVLKPGAFGFVFCIPRQDCLSRMMTSLELAGFNINFSSIYWTYASGFPKAMNIGKKIDKRAGVKGEEVIRPDFYARSNKKKSDWEHTHVPCGVKGIYNLPASEDAKRLEGSYGGFQPKPAVEVIIVVMKPLSKNSYIDQALDNGKGVTWLDDCRIPYVDENIDFELKQRQHSIPTVGIGGAKPCDVINMFNHNGRFPANLIVEDEVLDDGKISKSTKGFDPGSRNGTIFGCGRFDDNNTYSDSGSFSRYFSLDKWTEKNLPFLICPKASKSEKNRGVDKNNHPTVKPIKLMSYLITMGSREGDVILDPFSGSGTTGCAAVMLRRKYILIEMDKEYIEIIKARMKYYTEQVENEPLKI